MTLFWLLAVWLGLNVAYVVLASAWALYRTWRPR